MPAECPNVGCIEGVGQGDMGERWQDNLCAYERATKQVLICHEQVCKPLTPSSDLKDCLILNKFMQIYIYPGWRQNQ